MQVPMRSPSRTMTSVPVREALKRQMPNAGTHGICLFVYILHVNSEV